MKASVSLEATELLAHVLEPVSSTTGEGLLTLTRSCGNVNI